MNAVPGTSCLLHDMAWHGTACPFLLIESWSNLPVAASQASLDRKGGDDERKNTDKAPCARNPGVHLVVSRLVNSAKPTQQLAFPRFLV